MRFFLLFIFSIVLLFGSCKKSPTAKPAFFIRAENIKVATTSKQGSGSHKITDLWVYVNGKFQGSYPVGNVMPIVSNNEKVKLNVFAGIKNNGISGTRIYWSIYSLLDIDTLVEAGTTISKDFTFTYNSSAVFPWIEDFDGSTGYSLEKSPVSSVSYRIASPEDSFEGKSASLGLSGDSIVAQIQTTSSFSLPTGSSNVYLELNYKGNETFLVGLMGDDQKIKGALNVSAHADWNKIYIQLSDPVSNPPVFSKYKVVFQLLKKEVENPKIFLDNIKLVYLP